MTQPLSPAAQAIDEIIGDLYDKPVRCVVAAALRAVADKHMPEPLPFATPDFKAGAYSQQSVDRTYLLAIAAELEGQPSPNPQLNPPRSPRMTCPTTAPVPSEGLTDRQLRDLLYKCWCKRMDARSPFGAPRDAEDDMQDRIDDCRAAIAAHEAARQSWLTRSTSAPAPTTDS